MVEAHSKWAEVIKPMKTTTAEATTNATVYAQHLRKIWAP